MFRILEPSSLHMVQSIPEGGSGDARLQTNRSLGLLNPYKYEIKNIKPMYARQYDLKISFLSNLPND